MKDLRSRYLLHTPMEMAEVNVPILSSIFSPSKYVQINQFPSQLSPFIKSIIFQTRMDRVNFWLEKHGFTFRAISSFMIYSFLNGFVIVAHKIQCGMVDVKLQVCALNLHISIPIITAILFIIINVIMHYYATQDCFRQVNSLLTEFTGRDKYLYWSLEKNDGKNRLSIQIKYPKQTPEGYKKEDTKLTIDTSEFNRFSEDSLNSLSANFKSPDTYNANTSVCF